MKYERGLVREFGVGGPRFGREVHAVMYHSEARSLDVQQFVDLVGSEL
jgi:hypothetical protein